MVSAERLLAVFQIDAGDKCLRSLWPAARISQLASAAQEVGLSVRPANGIAAAVFVVAAADVALVAAPVVQAAAGIPVSVAAVDVVAIAVAVVQLVAVGLVVAADVEIAAAAAVAAGVAFVVVVAALARRPAGKTSTAASHC